LHLTLLLALPDRPQFDETTVATWTLLEGADTVLRTGQGTLASLPRSDRAVAIAPVSRLLFIETALPAVSPAKRNALLRYAIEDKLTIDPATVHAVVLGKSDGARHVIAAIDRGWLSAAIRWLRAAGINPDSLVSSAAGIRVDPHTWSVVLHGNHGYARRADGFVHNFDRGADSVREPPFGLSLALKEARARNTGPASLTVYAEPDDPALADAWTQKLGLPVVAAGLAEDPPSLLAAAKSANLLTGEFAPREARARWLTLLQPALIVLALIAMTHLVFTLIDNRRLALRQAAIEAEMRDTFKQAFPAAQAIVDAPLQMQRNLDQLKRERGIASDDDARMLIARVTKLLQSAGDVKTIKALSVNNGVANLDVELTGADQHAALERAAAALPGAAVTLLTDATAKPVAARITVRAGT
jgi:general secretion pathway protein L